MHRAVPVVGGQTTLLVVRRRVARRGEIGTAAAGGWASSWQPSHGAGAWVGGGDHVQEVPAAAVAVPGPSATYGSPEEAALAAAAQFHGAEHGLQAAVVFRFPEPDDYGVRVAVTRTSDDSCRVWDAFQVDRDGSRHDGWTASGDGRPDLC